MRFKAGDLVTFIVNKKQFYGHVGLEDGTYYITWCDGSIGEYNDNEEYNFIKLYSTIFRKRNSKCLK